PSSLDIHIFYRHLRSTRCPFFPYTTLFRSVPAGAATAPEATHADGAPIGEAPAAGATMGGALAGGATQSWSAPGDGGAATRTLEDRKSTRLNSSHVKISYAVFCLKKKKNT